MSFYVTALHFSAQVHDFRSLLCCTTITERDVDLWRTSLLFDEMEQKEKQE